MTDQPPPRTQGHLALGAIRLGWGAHRGLFTAALAMMALGSVTPAAVAWGSKLLVDGLTDPTTEPDGLVLLATAVVLLGGLGAVLGYLTGLVTSAQQRAIALHADDTLYAAVNRLAGLRYFEDPAFQDRLRLAEQSASSAPVAVANVLVAVVRTAVTVGAFLGVVVTVWWPMAILLLVVTLPTIWTQYSLAHRGAGLAEAMVGAHRRRFSYQALLTNLAAIKEIRLFGLGDLFHTRMIDGLRATNHRELALERRTATTQSLLTALGAAVAALGAGVVVYRAAHHQLSAGDVVLFVAAVAGVQGAFSGTINQLAYAGSAVRLFRHYNAVVHAEPDLTDGHHTPAALHEAIELHDVWFRYDTDGEWVLRGVTLRIDAGTAVGLVGLNGAGKSTLVKLLCRFYDPERGHITWDGVDLRELTIADLRRRIGVTFQDFMTYELSAAENIGVGDLTHLDDRDRITRAAALAEADQVIERLPRGYDTLVSRMFFDGAGHDAGVTLSGGQGQRVALARSLMRTDAELLILDEPSSGLDALAEHRVHTAMRDHRAGRTTILISHRLGALRDADTIVVLDHGTITETGNHETLMALGGGYATMFTIQAAGYQDEPATPPQFTPPPGAHWVSVPRGAR